MQVLSRLGRYMPTVTPQNARILLFTSWVAVVIARRIRQRKDAKKVIGDGDEDEETIKVHGVDMKFTQTKGEKMSLGWSDALTFWLPVIVRSSDLYQVLTWGKYTHHEVSASLQGMQLFSAIFTLIPFIEALVAEDWSNPTKEQQRNAKKNDFRYKLPLYAWTLVELLSTGAVLRLLSKPTKVTGLTRGNKFALLFILGFFNGAIGITASHELLHKNSWVEKFCGNLLLCNVNYMHWGDEHLNGHHEHVATPRDPATAKYGQSVYEFLPNSIIKSYISSFNLEVERLKQKDQEQNAQPAHGYKGFGWLLRPDNKMIWNAVLPFVWAQLLRKYCGGGWKTVAAFYAQASLGASLLEVVNYLEHYGLEREKLEDGSYEPVDPTHSWNSPHRLSNAVLFKLQRHSDHHTYSMRPYQLLRNFKESPQLPTGYAGMYMLSLCPPAYFWIMNPLVNAHNANKKRLQKLAEEQGSSPGFSKSKELEEAERQAKEKILKFIAGNAVVFGIIIRALLPSQT